MVFSLNLNLILAYGCGGECEGMYNLEKVKLNMSPREIREHFAQKRVHPRGVRVHSLENTLMPPLVVET